MSDAPEFLSVLRIIALILGVFFFSSIAILTNRLRYMFACSKDGYGLSISDPRITIASSVNTSVGAMDGNPTLTASGLLAGEIGRVRRPWSDATDVTFDDINFSIIVRDGWRGKKYFYCPEALYPQIKRFIQDRMKENKHGEDQANGSAQDKPVDGSSETSTNKTPH